MNGFLRTSLFILLLLIPGVSVVSGAGAVTLRDPGAVTWAVQQDPPSPPARMRTIYVWRGSPPTAVISSAFELLGVSDHQAAYFLASIVADQMGIERRFLDHPKYSVSSGAEMLADALRLAGYTLDEANVLAPALAAALGIDAEYDRLEVERRLAREAGALELNDLPLDAEHAAAFLTLVREGFMAVGYLDREADRFVETMRQEWNLPGLEQEALPNEPVLDWRRSNLHLLMADALVIAAGHTRGDAIQLACNALLRMDVGLDRETFDRTGATAEARMATAVERYDRRGPTKRRVYVLYEGATPVPESLRFNLSGDYTLDERLPRPVLRQMLNIPIPASTIRWS